MAIHTKEIKTFLLLCLHMKIESNVLLLSLTLGEATWVLFTVFAGRNAVMILHICNKINDILIFLSQPSFFALEFSFICRVFDYKISSLFPVIKCVV